MIANCLRCPNFIILFHAKKSHVLVYFKPLNHILYPLYILQWIWHCYIWYSIFLNDLVFIMFKIPTIGIIRFNMMVVFGLYWNFKMKLKVKIHYNYYFQFICDFIKLKTCNKFKSIKFVSIKLNIKTYYNFILFLQIF
jgi:hypothetical protein